jgi:predicted dehydrogenase
MTQKLRTGIVGCGKVGHLHAAALKSLPQSQFTAVCGGKPQRVREFAEKYSVKPYDSVDEMLAGAKLDAVCICTPHPLHAESAVKAALCGVHVLIEKSLASTLEDCDRMLEAARIGKVRIGTVCQRRFYAPCRRIRDAIDAGKIGKPIVGAVTMYGWRDQKYYESDPWRGKWLAEGGGVLVNQAPHQLDLLQWYMGEVDQLFAFWGNLNHPYIEVEDTAVAVLRFKSGALGQILVSNSQNPALFGKVFVSGSNGASVGVQTDGGAMFIAGMSNITEPPYNDIWTVPGETAELEKWKSEDAEFFGKINPMEYYHRLQIEEFLDAIMAGREPAITGEDGRKTVEIFTAIYRSQRDGKPVQFPLKAEMDRTDMDGRLKPTSN